MDEIPEKKPLRRQAEVDAARAWVAKLMGDSASASLSLPIPSIYGPATDPQEKS